MTSKYVVLLKDTFIFALGSFGTKIILFLMVPLYTNFMTEAEYGTADLVFAIAQLLVPFLSVVIFDSVIRFGLSKYEKKENVLLVGIIVFGLSTIIGAVFTPLLGFYPAISKWKWYLYCYVVFSILNSIEFNYLKAKGKNKAFALFSVIQTSLMASLNVYFLVFRSMGIQGYLLAYIIANVSIDVILIFIAGVYNDIRIATFDRDLFKRMIVYSAPLILNNVSWWIIHSSDKVMIEAMVSATALGIYTVSAKIPALINVMVSIFQQAWGISAVKEIESSNDTQYYSTVFRFLFLFIAASCIVFVAIIKVFMSYYVGPGFYEAWKYVPLLLVSAVFAAVASYYGSMYSALKKSVNNMITTVLAAGINIAVNWLFIPFVGIWGAVIGTIVAYIAIAFSRLLDVKRFVNIEIRWSVFISTIIILLTQAILVSLNYHVLVVSVISGFSFVVINRKDINHFISKLIIRVKP